VTKADISPAGSFQAFRGVIAQKADELKRRGDYVRVVSILSRQIYRHVLQFRRESDQPRAKGFECK
jgi:hypothetical protein